MVDNEVTGRMPGSTGLSHAARRQVGDEALVLAGLEEELGHAEVGQVSLAARKSRSLAMSAERGWPGRVGCHPDGEAADGPRQLHEIRGVGQLADGGVGVVGRIAAQGHEVLDACLAQRDQDVGQLEPACGPHR